MRLTADNQYRWQDTLLEVVRIGGVLAGLVLLSACSMSGTSQASQSARPVSPAPTRCRRPGETMDLTGSAFFHSGYYVSFSVLSDYPCHVRYVESIAVPWTRPRSMSTRSTRLLAAGGSLCSKEKASEAV